MIDRDVIEAFRSWADSSGRGYQTLMNDVLRATLGQDGQIQSHRRLLKYKYGATADSSINPTAADTPHD
jgi:hypothetical protein